MMGYHDGNWSGGGSLVMGSMMLLFLAVVIALVVWAARSVRGGRHHPDTECKTTTGQDGILAERFARGEIEEDEFARRRELLHNAPGPTTSTRSRS